MYLITRASLNLTRACNLACSYPCFTYGCTKGSMPFETARKIVDFLANQAAESGEKSIEISFWGGEPLIEWNLLKQIVLYTKAAIHPAISVSFGGTVNGTLLTTEKLDFLNEHNILFMVSIDGTQETHDFYRKSPQGFGSHKIIMRNMEKVLEKWPNYRVRMGPTADNIHRFYEDVKYLFDFGFNYIMFSPVYEGNWTEERWNIWEDQCYKVIDYMAELRKQGRMVEIEHFKSYISIDDSHWPCGASRNYVGFDIDGAIYPCHRFNKFNDNRPWQEKEVCIGHIDYGITRPEFRQKFIEFHPTNCGNCAYFNNTPCHGGCYAINYDFTGDINTAPDVLCRYVKLQKKVSEYYKEKIGINPINNGKNCICYNMCYAEGTDIEIVHSDKSSDITCVCYNSDYSGSMDPNIARKLR